MEVEHIKNMGMRLISAVTPSSAPPPDGAPILQGLKDAAEGCCSIYSGKKALATDQDLRVSNLLNQWLKVFMHGLKVPVSMYPPIQNIITAGLNFAFNLNLLDSSLWNYTKLHLTRHEEERFALLKMVNTPLGYFRAFLRSALNEKSLERYLQSWIGHNLRSEFYEDWALVRDPINAKYLPDIAAGLSSIFFAMSIDRSDLNESHIQVPNTHEPVISQDIPVLKSNADKIIHRQIMSFDKDDDSSKSESPMSSFETKENYLSNHFSGDGSDQLMKENISKSTEATKALYLTVDIGSQQDSDVSSLGGDNRKHNEYDLALESQMADLELCFSGDEHLEIDEENKSNILKRQYEKVSILKMKISHMEDDFNERSAKMEQVIHDLTKENNKLKGQLRNYVTAVETLKCDHSPNEEAKHYEEKLIQVAQMHAELMEFNDMLQKQLQRQIEPFGAHYPLSSLTGIPDSRVNIWIPSTFLISKSSKSFHIYQVFLKIGIEEWNVYRRYSEFRKLYNELKNSHPDVSTFKFPPKKTLGKREAWLVEQRRTQLQAWLRHIIQALPQLRQSQSRREMTSLVPFFRDPGNYEHPSVLRPLPTP